MESIETDDSLAYIDKDLDGDEYFKDIVGVTVAESMDPRNVVFWVDSGNAPYVKTKPLHKSQEILKEDRDGTLFKICVQINFELERLLLGFGDSLIVHKPKNYG